jgi:DNA-binding PadR family transcriptional regulator
MRDQNHPRHQRGPQDRPEPAGQDPADRADRADRAGWTERHGRDRDPRSGWFGGPEFERLREERCRRREQDHGERNFWSEWHDERHHHYHDGEIPVGQPLSPKEMEAWRDFFHQTFGTWPEEHWIFSGRRFSPWHQGMDSFNPFVATLLSKGGGLLPLYVLHLIAQQPRYGNEIMELLAERTNGQWVSNPGAIYPLLTLLEKEGFIDGKWEDPDKRTVRIYTITPTGQTEVSRIEMIVLPKLIETQQVLEVFINDLKSDPVNRDSKASQASQGPEPTPPAVDPEDLPSTQTGPETV